MQSNATTVCRLFTPVLIETYSETFGRRHNAYHTDSRITRLPFEHLCGKLIIVKVKFCGWLTGCRLYQISKVLKYQQRISKFEMQWRRQWLSRATQNTLLFCHEILIRYAHIVEEINTFYWQPKLLLTHFQSQISFLRPIYAATWSRHEAVRAVHRYGCLLK